MNNYSFIQRFLHNFALSSQLMREIMFDLEQSIFLRSEDIFPDNHVFVAGLARSGTTVLLNAIYQSNQFASLTYNDMPFILSPNLWSKISSKKNFSELQERAHTDNIFINLNSPEAFEEVFWKTFEVDLEVCKELFIKFVLLILKKNHRSRYLSKNNQNIRRLVLINEIFPKSKILVPFRDPIQQSFSLFLNHKKFIKKQTDDRFVRTYMDLIGHSEFGLDYKIVKTSNLLYPNPIDFNHWLEQWLLNYKALEKLSIKYSGIFLISYGSLCNNPKIWNEVKNSLELDMDLEFVFSESIKDINQEIDRKLSIKCYDLFNSMEKHSIGSE
jgi:hypothetical protein